MVARPPLVANDPDPSRWSFDLEEIRLLSSREAEFVFRIRDDYGAIADLPVTVAGDTNTLDALRRTAQEQLCHRLAGLSRQAIRALG